MKKFEVKNKLLNAIMLHGEKNTSERNLFKTIKKLQKFSTKQSKKILLLSLINSTPIFKLHQRSNKKIKKKKKKKPKLIPAFIKTDSSRVSSSIKFIINNSKKSNSFFSDKLPSEILLLAKNDNRHKKPKDEMQKKVLLNKQYFKYYRW